MLSSATALWLGPLGAFLSSLTWAIGTASYSKLSAEHTPFAINTTRALVALPCFLLALIGVSVFETGGLSGFVREFSEFPARSIFWCAVSMTCSYGMGDTLFFVSARTLGVPSALAIASSYPLWTAWFGWQFRGEALPPAQIVGLLVTVIGMISVILLGARGRASGKTYIAKPSHADIALGLQDSHPEKSRVEFGWALLAALAASAFWACNSFAVSQAGRGISPLTGNAVRMIFAILISFGLGQVWARGHKSVIPLRAVRRLAWVFVIEGFLGSLFFMYGLAHTTLAVGATLASVSPVLALPVAWAMGLEKVSWERSLAIAITVTGLCVLVGSGLS